LLKDKKAINELLKFQKYHTLSDSKLLNNIEIYEKCETLLQEKEVPLTRDTLQDLLQLGIGRKERQELSTSLGGDRTESNLIIQEIQESCANKLIILKEFNEFTDYMLNKAK